VQGKLARPVRWGAEGKGLDNRHLARSLPNSEGGRRKRSRHATSPAAYPTQDYTGMGEAQRGLGRYFGFYNTERPHQALGYRTPRAVYAAG
jgi:transposase InsO family protein